MKKSLEDYKKLAEEKEFEYILNNIPKDTHTTIKGWKCKKGHIWSASYNTIQQGRGCPECRKKSLEDYKKLAEEKEFEYILNNIPEDTQTTIKGWKCKKGHIWSASYNTIQQGSGCPECRKKSLEDYKKLAEEKEFEYILNNIPEDTQTTIKGWKCKKGHIWSASYNKIQQGRGCPECRKKSLEDYKKLAEEKE